MLSMSAGSVGLLESRTPSAMQGLGYSAGSEPASRTTHHTPIEIGIEKVSRRFIGTADIEDLGNPGNSEESMPISIHAVTRPKSI